MPHLSYEKLTIIGEEKEIFYTQLGSSKALDRRKLENITDKIDDEISTAIKKVIMKRHEYIFKENSVVTSATSLNIDGVLYTVTTDAQDALFTKVFTVSFIPFMKNDRAPELISEYRRIPKKGKFREIMVRYPREILNIDEYFLFNLSISLFNIGYDWLNTTLIRTIKETIKDLNDEIYEFVNRMIQTPSVLEGFIFSALTTDRGKKDKDFVLLDDRATSALINLAEKSNYAIGDAPAKLVADMVFDVIPIEESVIADVVNNRSKTDIDLTKTDRYSSNEFAKTLRAVWGDTVCCYPINSEGRFLLVAFYPKHNDKHITKHLKMHKVKLNTIARKNFSSIGKTLKVLDKINGKESVLFLSEVLGRFLSAFSNPNPS